MANFDAAGREMCTVRQTRTSTPLQALILMNDVTFVEAARAMAQRSLQAKGTTTAQLKWCLSLVGIEATEAKLKSMRQSHSKYTAYFRENREAATEFLSNGEWKHDENQNELELAAMTAVASVILNLDEVVVRQ